MPFLFLRSSPLYKRLDFIISLYNSVTDRVNRLYQNQGDVYQKLGHINNNMSRIYERLDQMQTALDGYTAAYEELKAKIEEWKSRPSGLPAEKVNELAAGLRALTAILS